ncbi:MAG: hypothetical protein HKP27_11130 [Myxococcales bacterium]|nr:hypothetical protein [Myxococcales bacterium]
MIQFDRDQFRNTLNADGEFSVTAEFWDTDLHLGLGDFRSLLKIRDGQVAEIRETKEIEQSDIVLTGPEAEWKKALEPVPEPYYHHLFSAVCFHGISWGGDVEGAMAYLGALNRMVDLLREHARVS